MEYRRFRNEDELLKALIKSKSAYNVYPKITSIAGERIKPDIDLLELRKEGENQCKIIGYECKLLKFNQRSKALSWENFYKGIGQALLYMRNGVGQTILILGFHENVLEDRVIDNFKTIFYENIELFKQIFSPFFSIGILIYEGGTTQILLEQDSYFYHLDAKTKLFRDAILQNKFNCKKCFLNI